MVTFFEWIESLYDKYIKNPIDNAIDKSINSIIGIKDDILGFGNEFKDFLDEKFGKLLMDTIEHYLSNFLVTGDIFKDLLLSVGDETEMEMYSLEKLGYEHRSYRYLIYFLMLISYYWNIINAIGTPKLQGKLNFAWSLNPTKLLDVMSLIALYKRGIIDFDRLKEEVKKNGYDVEKLNWLLDLYLNYPTPSDIIRFMVRDVFDEEAVKRGKFDQDFENKLKGAEKYIEIAGLTHDILKLYWRSHWQLPSPNQIYEMVHRGIIDLDEAKELLKQSDYAPNYVDKLLAIAYNPYTRVDVRRMYELGVLTYDEMVKAYKDIGYDEEHAKNLADFTVLDVSDVKTKKDRDLTKSEILTGFIYGELTQEEAIGFLEDLGYDKDEAEFLLELYSTKEERRLDNWEIRVLEKEYAKGIKTYEEVMRRLDEMGVSERRKQLVSRELDLRKREMAIS